MIKILNVKTIWKKWAKTNEKIFFHLHMNRKIYDGKDK